MTDPVTFTRWVCGRCAATVETRAIPLQYGVGENRSALGRGPRPLGWRRLDISGESAADCFETWLCHPCAMHVQNIARTQHDVREGDGGS